MSDYNYEDMIQIVMVAYGLKKLKEMIYSRGALSSLNVWIQFNEKDNMPYIKYIMNELVGGINGKFTFSSMNKHYMPCIMNEDIYDIIIYLYLNLTIVIIIILL
jgi:hypothetical protein